MLRITTSLSLILRPARHYRRDGMMGRLYIVSEWGEIKNTNKELLCFAAWAGLSLAAAQLDHKTRLKTDYHLWFGFKKKNKKPPV